VPGDPASAADWSRLAVTRLERREATIAVVGQGYVGLPVAVRAAEQGFTVVGFDVDPARVDALRDGRSYVEDVSPEAFARALARGYRPSADPGALTGFDVAVISVPTPLRDGNPDLAHVEAAAATVADHLRPGACVILESTTYPGTTTELVAPILEAGSGLQAGREFFLGYSPERIDPGNRTWTLVNTPKVVSGIDAASLAVVEAFYGALVERCVSVGSPAEAELVKLLENTFRHVNIALVNELAMFARDLGVDIWSAIDAASTKPFGYMRFTPGPGVGGHCLPIDPSYLSWSVKRRSGRAFRFVELANDVNAHMPEYVVRRITALLNDKGLAVNGARILLLGLTYKAGTSDWRESPSIALARLLAPLGARLAAIDPHIPPEFVADVELPLREAGAATYGDADLVVLLVDHPDFDLDELCEHAPLVLDTKGVLRTRPFRGELL
jgi:nucleotide sugar dehydrogenase